MWRFYLIVSELAFRHNGHVVFQIQLAKKQDAVPLTREYLTAGETQSVLAKKHLGWNALKGAAGIALKCLMRGQTNFVRMLWKFNSVYNPQRQAAEHARPVKYAMRPPQPRTGEHTADNVSQQRDLFVHLPVVGATS